MDKNIRLLSILERLSSQEKVCVKRLALEWEGEVTLRTIQSDFKTLKEYFQEKLFKEKGCYALLDKEKFSKIFENNLEITKEFLRLVGVVDSKLYANFLREYSHLLKPLKLNKPQIYQISDNPYEELKQENEKLLEKLETAISLKQYINIIYSLPPKGNEVFSHSIPLKILYLGSNWYLALITTNDVINNSNFKLLRINFISKITQIKVEPTFFHNDNTDKIEADRFLKNIQSSFSNINATPYQIVLKIHADKARYFQNKKYLTTQKIIKKLKNGELLVSYLISNDMEIIPLIQRWIPFVFVVEPLRIKEKIDENLKLFMKG